MSAKQIKELLEDEKKFTTMCRSIFDEMDNDKNGYVDMKEMEKALAKMSKMNGLPPPSKKEVIETIKMFDENSDGKIVFEEFLNVTRKTYERNIKSAGSKNDVSEKEKKSQNSIPEIAEALMMEEKIYMMYCTSTFKLFDKSNDNFIDFKELQDALTQFGNKAGRTMPSKQQLQALYKKYDVNKDRKISFDEFLPLVREVFNISFMETSHPEQQLLVEEQSLDADDPKARNAEEYLRYVEETGISMSFKVIFAEILSKKIPEDKIFAYTATRLRQIGEDIAYIQNSKYRKAKY